MVLRILIFLTCLLFVATVNDAAEPTFGQTIKKIFSTPTPTPHRKKKTTATAAKKKSPTPTPTPSKKTSSARGESSFVASPSASPRKKKTTSPTEEESPPPGPRKKKSSSTPTPTLTPSPHRKKRTSPSPEPSETPAVTPSATTSPSPTPEPSLSSGSKTRGAPNATLLPNEIKGFENYPLKVQKLLTAALELTTRNLDYKYGSDDPANGGMDCSGFVYYVLRQNEVAGVPRDSSAQYVWLRRTGTFEPVISRHDNSFELENLRPGDLLFWTGTYSIDRDPPITHAMIYLGREKKTGKRVMVGASDGRVYQGESRFGVSVFDFTIPRPEKNGNGKLQPQFVGYAHIPDLQD
jgi:cell wall-associated NlpC family hydrolase